MELRDAIDQLTTIRSQLAATEHLKSLRAVPVAVSSALAAVAAPAQALWLTAPAEAPERYLALWLTAAGVSAMLAAAMVARRTLRSPGGLGAANTWCAVRLFSPCLVVGAVCTWFVATEQPQLTWLLPALWQLLFGLGNLATARLLPAPAAAVGVMFLVTGASCLWLGERALAPWAMGVPFATGQAALAAILWWHNERPEPRS
ncbi:MAG: hypothetical protein ACON4Z_14570 [Planctomycetota bacterium]